MSNYSEKFAITTGDPNGVGPEITIKALNMLNISPKDVVIISNSRVINRYGKFNNNYEIIEIDYDGKIEPGGVSASSGEFSFQCLKKACEIKPRYIVTAPTSKEAMYLAGRKFNGQTEVVEKYLAHDNQKAEMLFASRDFRVLLLTRHCALKDVAKNISKEAIVEKVLRLKEYFQNYLNKNNPSFALCAINPHAGENGVLGTEEIEIVKPAVDELRNLGVNITDPMPADTLFVKGVQNYVTLRKMPYDCYVASYHDQGLIPIKTVGGYDTVNITIGLDVLRTSPSHGTAFDIAGRDMANPASMIEAIKMCLY